MSTNKILLGILRKDAGTCGDGEAVYLTKHSWDCGWYWSFGYLGNSNCHFHFDSLLHIKDGKGGIKYEPKDLFLDTKIGAKDWWIMRDLFVQAYALKNCSEVYRYGGHQTSVPGTTDVIMDKEMVRRINTDLEKVLDTLWNHVIKATSA